MYRLYKATKYIVGDLVSSHRTLTAAKKAAKQLFDNPVFEKDSEQTWIDNKEGMPIGIITHED